MATFNGKVNNVWTIPAGSFLAADVAIGDGVLHVIDAYPFSDNGGILRLNGISRSYTSVDYEANTITLLATMSVTAAAEDPVSVYPTGGRVTMAMVELGDGDEGIRAIVPYAISTMLPTGMRDSVSLTQESVVVSDASGRMEVVSLDEELPAIISTAFYTADPADAGSYIGLENDVAGGLLKAWTGVAGEATPGTFNPAISPSNQPMIYIRSGTSATYPNYADINLIAGDNAGTPALVSIGVDTEIVGRLAIGAFPTPAVGISGFAFDGPTVLTSDASGIITVPHNLNLTAKFATVQGHSSLPLLFRWTGTPNVNQVTFEARRTDTNALVVSTALTVGWLVIA